MAKNVTLMGASYSDVPAVQLPQTGGGTATFTDTSDASADASNINSGYSAYVNGTLINGTQVIQACYVGSSDPSATTGNNGDLYLKVVS